MQSLHIWLLLKPTLTISSYLAVETKSLSSPPPSSNASRVRASPVDWRPITTHYKEGQMSSQPITAIPSLQKLYAQGTVNLTFPFLTSSRANCTTLRTFDAIHRYLKNLWWADQNWPHMDFFIRCSASIRLAACWNFSLALTHCKKRYDQQFYKHSVTN